MIFKRSVTDSSRQPARRRAFQPTDTAPATNTDLQERYAFRRNRTLTGSSSPMIASSNELNAELRSPRAHVHHLTSLRRRLLLYFGLVGMAALGLYLLLSQLVATTTVQVAGVGLAPLEDSNGYQNALDSYYAARPAERLRFLLNERALVSHMQFQRPEIKSVTIDQGSSLGEASVTITARRPIARWDIDGNNQYVDAEGAVFRKNYFSDPGLQIVDNSGLQATSNRLVASNRFLGFVGRVIAGASNNGLTVDTVTIPALTTRQITMTLKGKPTVYKLSVDRSAGQQVEDIARIDRYLASRQMRPGYVDVRLSGKAYYK